MIFIIILLLTLPFGQALSFEKGAKMRGLRIGEVSKITGITIKTLRHFDKIDLLRPSSRDESGYRRYSRQDLLKLQSVLFYRELKIPLNEIKQLLNQNEIQLIDHLKNHEKSLNSELERIQTLLKTLNKTIKHMENNTPITEEELYEGFSKEEIKAIKTEVQEKYDPKIVVESQNKVKSWTRDQLNSNKQVEASINFQLSELMHLPIDSPKVQEQIAKHFDWVNQFYTCTNEIYIGLSDLYVTDARFMSHYEEIKPGLAQFLSKAMKVYIEK